MDAEGVTPHANPPVGLTAVLALVLVSMSGSGGREYCPWEVMRAKCPAGHVIIIQNATYGRMQLGRCVRNDLGYVGCATDVLTQADNWCSGRRDCTIPVPNADLDSVTPCLEDLKAYLDAEYTCLPVLTLGSGGCRAGSSNVIHLSRHSSRFLASSVVMETPCGSGEPRPWVVTTRPGYRLNVTLWDFMRPGGRDQAARRGAVREGTCHRRYATLLEQVEGAAGRQLVCGGGAGSPRRRTVFTSGTHRLEVRMHGPRGGAAGRATAGGGAAQELQEEPAFMLEFQQVQGCSDPDIPNGVWYERQGASAKMGCTENGATWRLECESGIWTGEMGICGNVDPKAVGIWGTVLPSGLSIVIIVVVSLLIGCLILALGLYSLRRQRRLREQRTRPPIDYPSKLYDTHPRPAVSRAPPGDYKHQRESNEYASIWEWPLPPPPITAHGDPGVGRGDGGRGSGYGTYCTPPSRDGSTSGTDRTYQCPDIVPSHSSSADEDDLPPRYFELDGAAPPGDVVPHVVTRRPGAVDAITDAGPRPPQQHRPPNIIGSYSN